MDIEPVTSKIGLKDCAGLRQVDSCRGARSCRLFSVRSLTSLMQAYLLSINPGICLVLVFAGGDNLLEYVRHSVPETLH
ncbi:hypothetical protein QMY54_00357 (plasmid) [Pseudomonas rhodesiae]|nr:hypothetical protein QMY54_00357 [Pseudomonas rhodesiae]